MSVRYSSSPALRLEIARSRHYQLVQLALCLLVFFCLYRISQQGYQLLSLVLLPIVTVCCWQLCRQRFADSVICWSQGQWSIQTGGCCRAITIKHSSALPWVIYLAWLEVSGRSRGSLFLFNDSASAQELRELRVRLTLER